MTKSGQIGGNFSCCGNVNFCQFSSLIKATSGDRLAPFGKQKIVDELKTIPSFLSLFHIHNILI
jgi:hypothetical protein